MYANVLKFHILMKNSVTYILFLSELSPILELFPF